MPESKISVFLADDNLIVREGVKALIISAPDIDVVGTAADYDSLIAGASAAAPQVVVTDIRMPPSFQSEGIDAAREIRQRHPGTGIVVLSQYDDPDYAISLLGGGASGYAYLLKDRVAEGDQLQRAIREVATGGSMLDPRIVESLVRPASQGTDLTKDEAALLQMLAEGRPIKAIAVVRRTTPADVDDAIQRLFLKLAQAASTGAAGALRQLKQLYQAIVDREEQGETLSRLLPTGVADLLRRQGRKFGETEMLTVTVLMSDVRGYSTIAEDASPTVLARQLNEHRAEMNRAILAQGGTVMQFVGDSVMAVFGAPVPQTDHARRALATARAMHDAQVEVNARWAAEGLPAFNIGIGLSTGDVAAALLGSDERVEYSIVGDIVNLAQRLQQLAGPRETILSEATYRALGGAVQADALPPLQVKGRHAAVNAYRVGAPVRVLIVDDQRTFRDAARAVVDATTGFEVVGEADSGESGVQAARHLQPDLVLLDVNLPGMNGFETTRRILHDSEGRTAVILLSTYAQEDFANQVAGSGAIAYISKSQFEPARLVAAWMAARRS